MNIHQEEKMFHDPLQKHLQNGDYSLQEEKSKLTSRKPVYNLQLIMND